MPPSLIRRLLSLVKTRAPNLLRAMVRTFFYILRIVVSFLLLPVDNVVLVTVYFVKLLTRPWSTAYRRRSAIRKNDQFDQKTVLITGINSREGLVLARRWYFEGHRVIGAEVADIAVRSGESKSTTLAAFYDIAKPRYIYRLLEIIHREKVDLWIPCADQVDVMFDATVKQTIESRTHCRCVHLDPELTKRFESPSKIRQFLVDKDLPVLEKHQVQSRDSVHKILHRSPSKVYLMWKPGGPVTRVDASSSSSDMVLSLPKRTMSMTYSEISEVHINKDNPWVLQQESRLGEYFAEMLVIQGSVKAITIRPGKQLSEWGSSRLDQGLASAIHRLMDRFAQSSGRRLTSHLCVHMVVDEEFQDNHVRQVVHITGCQQGATACETLLRDPPSNLIAGYLALLSPASEASGELQRQQQQEQQSDQVETQIAPASSSSSLNSIQYSHALEPVPLVSSLARACAEIAFEVRQLPFWRDERFSRLDPFPWWWHAHVYIPFRQLDRIFSQ